MPNDDPDDISPWERDDDFPDDDDWNADDYDPADECGRWNNGRLTKWCTLAGTEFCEAERGGRPIEVPAAYSSQTCAECGVIDAASRKEQRFRCAACGQEDHADVNAAKIILKRAGDTGLLPVEASGCRAGEAGTSREAA